MQRPDGKHAVTVILTQQDVDALQLIMAETYRETMTDCIRAIIREKAKNFLPAQSVVTDKSIRTKHAANITIN